MQGFCRRKEAEMSVYKRGGVYYYDFSYRGRRYKKSTGLTNKTAALDMQAQRRAELAQGRTPLRKCPSFSCFVEEAFLPWSEVQHQNNRTHERYVVSCKVLVRFVGKSKVDEIDLPAEPFL